MSKNHLLLIDWLNDVRRIWEAIPVEDSPEKTLGAQRRFGVSSSQFQDLLALSGDSTDNIPVEKTAAKWFGVQGTLDAVLPEAQSSDPKASVL